MRKTAGVCIALLIALFQPFYVCAYTESDLRIDPNSAAYKAAEKATATQNSMKMQEAIAQQRDRLRNKYKGRVEGGYSQSGDELEGMSVNHAPRILIFISESMPDELLHRLVNQSFELHEAEVAEVKFVLRGKPQIGVKPFGSFLNPEGRGMIVSVDPFLYEKLEIERVPIVIFDRKYVVKFPDSLLSALDILNDQGLDYTELSDAIKEAI